MTSGTPADQAVLTILVQAAGDPSILASLQAEARANGKTLTEYLALMKTQQELDPPGANSVHAFLTRMTSPTAPAPAGTSPAPTGPGGPTGAARDFQRRHFVASEIYGALGDPNVREVGGRILAYNMTFLTSETGQIVPTLVVADITNTSDIQAFNIPLHASKGQTIQFGLSGKTYSITLNPSGNDVAIVFPGAEGLPSAGALSRLAAQRAAGPPRHIVDVGGKEYIIGGQGFQGGGGNTFWTAEMLAKLNDPDFNPLLLMPDMSAGTVRMEGGLPVPITQSSIGQVNGKWYDMVWNSTSREFEIKEGLPPSRNPGTGAETGPWVDLTSIGITPGTGAATDSPQARAAFQLNTQLAASVTNARVVFSEGTAGADGRVQVARGFWLMTKRDGSSFVPLNVGPTPDASKIAVLSLDGTPGNRHWLTVTTDQGVAFADLRGAVAPGFATIGQTSTNAFVPAVAGAAPSQMKAVTDPALARYLMTERMGIPRDAMDEIIRKVNEHFLGNTNYAWHGSASKIMVAYTNNPNMYEVYPGVGEVTDRSVTTTPPVTDGSLGARRGTSADRHDANSPTLAVDPPVPTPGVTTVNASREGPSGRLYKYSVNGVDYYYTIARMPGGGSIDALSFVSVAGHGREVLPAGIVYPTLSSTLPVTDTWQIRRRPVAGNPNAGVLAIYSGAGEPNAPGVFVDVLAYWGVPDLTAARTAATATAVP